MKERLSHHSKLKAKYGFLDLLSIIPYCRENQVQSPPCALKENTCASVAFLTRLPRLCSCFLWRQNQRNPKHQAQKKKKKKIRQLWGWEMQMVAWKYHEREKSHHIWWEGHLPKEQKSLQNNKQITNKQNHQPRTKPWKEWDCMGWVAVIFWSGSSLSRALCSRHLRQESRAVIWPGETSYPCKPNFSWLWKFSFDFATGTFRTDSNDRHSFLSFIFLV